MSKKYLKKGALQLVQSAKANDKQKSLKCDRRNRALPDFDLLKIENAQTT